MLLAGMATRTFWAMVFSAEKNPIQRKAAKETPRRKLDPPLHRFVVLFVFMTYSFQSMLILPQFGTGGVYGSAKFLSIEIFLVVGHSFFRGTNQKTDSIRVLGD